MRRFFVCSHGQLNYGEPCKSARDFLGSCRSTTELRPRTVRAGCGRAVIGRTFTPFQKQWGTL
jgi:hypothetical protein